MDTYGQNGGRHLDKAPARIEIQGAEETASKVGVTMIDEKYN